MRSVISVGFYQPHVDLSKPTLAARQHDFRNLLPVVIKPMFRLHPVAALHGREVNETGHDLVKLRCSDGECFAWHDIEMVPISLDKKTIIDKL